MRPPSREIVVRDIHALAVGVAFSILIVSVIGGIFIAIWGWTRFRVDLWPLDRSSVGPNIIASFITATLVVAHNEGRVVQRDFHRSVGLEQMFRDIVAEVIHPVETFQENLADKVADKIDDEPSDPEKAD